MREIFFIKRRKLSYLQATLFKILAVQQKTLYSFYFKKFELDNISLQSVVYLYHKQPQVFNSARKDCELIGQKWYHH